MKRVFALKRFEEKEKKHLNYQILKKNCKQNTHKMNQEEQLTNFKLEHEKKWQILKKII